MSDEDLVKELRGIRAAVDMAVEYGKQANERLGWIELRLQRIERHVGLNGIRELDTEPAPATEPENRRPGEV